MRFLIVTLWIFFIFCDLNASDLDSNYRILGTNLLCNYDIWDYRLYEHKIEIKNSVIFRHIESGNELSTKHVGIIMGEKPRQRVQIIDGVQKRLTVKQVLDFKELYNWSKEIEISLR
jgi:hypothetical protein